MQFESINQVNDRTYTFRLSPIHVSYANTLRRLILTGVESIAFRADMTSTGSTTDVVIQKNDTPMTNEMLAHRIGLLPIHITEPLKWNGDKYIFNLKVEGLTDSIRYVTSSDFQVLKKVDGEDEPVSVDAKQFFPVNSITGQTCIIASLQPAVGGEKQNIEILARATLGTGRENARFIPVSQCTYEYTRDNDPIRKEEMFNKWLVNTKMIREMPDKTSEKYQALQREFNTMEVARCYLLSEKGEPFSFDYTIESVGVLTVPYIVQRACEVGESMCSRYVNIDKGTLPSEITISTADSRITGYDFLFRGQDHTLGNLLQTWLVENHIDGTMEPKIIYAGYNIPHPLRDEMVLRIGVADGEESTARKAVSEACKGCADMFRKLREAWMRANNIIPPNPVPVTIRGRMTPRVAQQ